MMELDAPRPPVPMLEIGAHDRLPHYSVDGHAHNFYVWVRKPGDQVGCASAPIKGAIATSHHKALTHLHRTNQPEFMALCDRLMVEHKWAPSPGPSWQVCEIRESTREGAGA